MLISGFYAIGQTETNTEVETCHASCHCQHNLVPIGVTNSHIHKKNEWMSSYRYMGMTAGTPISGSSEITEMEVYKNYMSYTSNMNMGMHMLMAMYGITDRLTTMVMANYNSNSMNMSMMQMNTMLGMEMKDTKMSMKTTGFGDTKVYLNYNLSKNSKHTFLLNVGVNIPTGSIQMKGMENDMLYPNSRLPYMMQMGSGTFDILPGLTYNYQLHNLALGSQFSSVIRTSKNNVGYQYGNNYNLNLWIAYNWWNNFSSSLRFQGSNSEAIKGVDPTVPRYKEIAANPDNYGSNLTIGYLGTVYNFQSGFLKNARVGVEYGMPIYQKVNGIQNQLKQSLIASFSYSF